MLFADEMTEQLGEQTLKNFWKSSSVRWKLKFYDLVFKE